MDPVGGSSTAWVEWVRDGPADSDSCFLLYFVYFSCYLVTIGQYTGVRVATLAATPYHQ
jgi:hypothetical protein